MSTSPGSQQADQCTMGRLTFARYQARPSFWGRIFLGQATDDTYSHSNTIPDFSSSGLIRLIKVLESL